MSHNKERIPSVLPPTYQASQESAIDEDILPNYSSALNYNGLIMLKHELTTPFQLPNKQSELDWEPYVMELNSTQLNIYKLKDIRQCHYVKYFFENMLVEMCLPSSAMRHTSRFDPHLNIKSGKVSRKSPTVKPVNAVKVPKSVGLRGRLKNFVFGEVDTIVDDRRLPLITKLAKQDIESPEFHLVAEVLNHQDNFSDISSNSKNQYYDKIQGIRGELFKSLTLQRCQVGSASDHIARPFAIRMRCELQQFMVCCYNPYQFINWYYKLVYAIDIALPLELREFNQKNCKTIPRRSRRISAGRRNTFASLNDYSSLDIARPRANSVPVNASERRNNVPQDVEDLEDDGYDYEIFENSQSERAIDDCYDESEKKYHEPPSIPYSNSFVTYSSYEEFLNLRYAIKCIKSLKLKKPWLGHKVTFNFQYIESPDYSESDSDESIVIKPHSLNSPSPPNGRVPEKFKYQDFIIQDKGLFYVEY
ncbi:BA75_03440T0 [Komagataella pastoris]|uniref:BA75_03440T0 n=1 Tax=Komagataella pastoris TaxID=4922 RepID=A0A1B2JHF2_PICPA|nr:BA75_03440T0 [Komagataella pastoris]